MHSLIAKLLNKKGVKDVAELSDEPMPDGSPTERQTIEKWQKILSSQEKVTVENITEFCQKQLDAIEGRMSNVDNNRRINERLVLLHGVYKALLKATKAPQTERETLEKYLQSLLTTK